MFASGEYYQAAERTSKLNEHKLKGFLFNIYRLLYGEDRSSRLARVDKNTRQYILDNVSKDAAKDFSIAKNEFENANRTDYKHFMIPGGEPIGSENWSEVFRRTSQTPYTASATDSQTPSHTSSHKQERSMVYS